MKTMKLLTLAVFAAAALFIAGCSNSPSAVTEKFYKALGDNDQEAIQEYGTEKAAKIIGGAANVLSGMKDLLGGKDDKDAKKGNEKFKTIEIVKEEINGEKAIVTAKLEDGKEFKVSVEKIDGKWKVAGPGI